MITLYESILGSTKSGKYQLIKDWCERYKPFEGNYKINSDNTISSTQSFASLHLDYIDYDCLPDYIQFKSSEYVNVIIGPPRGVSSSKMKTIKNFNGLPKRVHAIKITIANNRTLPKLNIEVESSFTLNSFMLKKYEDLRIDFFGKDDLQCELNLRSDAPLDNVHVKHVKTIDFVNDFNLGDEFSKIMNRKAEKNKYKGKFDYEIKPEGYKAIEEFFKDTDIDLKDCICIKYTQASQLLKKDGKWYRFKNWY
jgi:hypothetical protein